MKKIMIFMLIVFVLTGCGNHSPGQSNSQNNGAAPAAAPTQLPAGKATRVWGKRRMPS